MLSENIEDALSTCVFLRVPSIVIEYKPIGMVSDHDIVRVTASKVTKAVAGVTLRVYTKSPGQVRIMNGSI